MTYRNVKAATLGLLWMVSCVPHALGQAAAGAVVDASTPVESSVLALSVGADVVDRDALRRALEAELGVVVEDAGNAPAYMPTLSVLTLPNGNTEVALSSRTVPRSTREFLLSAQIPEERVEMVTLIAANLIRNEAAALLPELRPAAKPVEVAAPAPMAPAKLVNPCSTERPREFGIDLAPGVGASSSARGKSATRAFSLAFAGSLYDRLHGFELGWTGANIVRKSVCGVQVSLVGANVSWGPVVGTQLAMFNLVKGSLLGAQLGIASVTIGDLRGVQGGLVAIDHGRITGAQLGVANYARHGFEGAQGAVLNLAFGDSRGAQLGVANFVGGDMRGFQGSVLNIAVGEVKGAQLGVANVTTGEATFQLGVFNYTERSKASVGLFSIVRKGRTSVDLTAAVDSSLGFVSVTHGGKYVHNVLGVGLRLNPDDTRFATLYGVGVRALSNRWLRLDIDLLSHNVYSNDVKTKGVSMVASVRVPLTLMLVRGLGVMVAPSYNFSVIDNDETRALHNFGSTRLYNGELEDDPNVHAWPGVTLGLRYEFDHGV